jgi:glycosyltransferase involved in cell wall biosynthesis
MRIAHICTHYETPTLGGVQVHVGEITKRLARQHDVYILATDPTKRLPKEEVIDGICVKRFNSWAPGAAYYLSLDLERYLDKCSEVYDIVHAHNYQGLPAFHAARAKGRYRFVFAPHYHGAGHSFLRNLLHIPYRYVGKQIFDRADRVICVSKYEQDLLTRNFRIDNRKISLIPNGVNPKEFEGLKKETNGGTCIILCVGRLERYKGVDHLIRALPKLESNVRLDIVGKGTHKKVLVKLANQLAVGDRVTFSEDLSRKELVNKYNQASVFVLLSRHEAYGISVAEALAAKTPCIVANASALTEWVDNRNCFGIDYPIQDEELVCLIKRAMGRTVDTMPLPTWDEAVEKLLSVYEHLQSSLGKT